MSQPSIAPSAFHADISRIDKYAPAELIGRKAEIQLLSDAWDKAVLGEANRPRVLTFVALGGEGKTSLVAKWAANLAHLDWPGFDAVFAWSFYYQGSDEKTPDSSELFLKEALTFFGDPALASSAQRAPDKGRRLAQLVGQRRALLILDGVEPLQYAPTSPRRGELKDAGLSTLLKGLAASNRGLCIVTTRYDIADLRAYWETTAPQTLLPRLSKAAGVALLRALGVTGKPSEFEKLVEDVHGHALTLNLLGSYLHEAHAGDIHKRYLVRLEEADDEQGGHAFRVMDAYVKWLESDGEKGERALAVLRLLGLFDRPASADCLGVLFQAPVIPDLTEPLVGTSEAQRNLVFSRLESARLLTVNRNAAGALIALDAHPLLRDYFARQLKVNRVVARQMDAISMDGISPALRDLIADHFAILLPMLPEAWCGAHRRLFKHLCQTTREGDQPTLEDLQPLYQAVVHGCKAGMQDSWLMDSTSTLADSLNVFYNRIYRGGRSTLELGAVGADLGALAFFFETPWSRISESLTPKDRGAVLKSAAVNLLALGRLTEVMELMRASPEYEERSEHEKESVVCADRSRLMLMLGDVDEAMRNAELAGTYIPYSSLFVIIEEKVIVLAIQADVLHQAGQRTEADARFREAERLMAEIQKIPWRNESLSCDLLFAERGFWYCDLLLAAAERAAWQCFLASAGFRQAIPSTVLGAPQRKVGAKSLFSRKDARSYDEQGKRRSGQGSHAPQIQSCRGVFRRAAKTLQLVIPKNWLLPIALDHLTLGRTALYQAILEGSSLNGCRTSVEYAVDGLRHSGQEVHLPRGLLTRAWLRSLSGALTVAASGPESAQHDLDEAWEIAERGPMPLFLADIHLHRARLFGPHASGTIGEPYPWESPAVDLAAARQLIEKHGYWRRKEELEDAEAAAKTWVGDTDPIRLT